MSISEDIMDGSCCQFCTLYFKSKDGNILSHGHPVVCRDCWRDLKKSEKKRYILTKAKMF